jgi:hypothetical protein
MKRCAFAAVFAVLSGACASGASGRTDAASASDASKSNCDPNDTATKSGLPNRCEAAEAMQALQPDIARCSSKQGVVLVAVTFDSYGIVRDAQVEAKGYDADAALCVKGHALLAKVRPFTAPKFLIKWPYRVGGSD